MDLFDEVNDPYVQQRLYAVVHGCVFRGKCGQSQSLGKIVFDRVFKNDPIRADILLRDYARCAVDFISQNVDLPDIDIERINPPYRVLFSFDSCPDRKTVEQKYRIDVSMGYSEKAVYTQKKLLASMETEYSNGTGGYGDFGRYIFESSMRGWADCEGFNASLIRNYALDIIFEKYKFDATVYSRHDTLAPYGRGSRPVMERFGKKFQRIAMYEILGLLQDNYHMEPWFSNLKDVQCDGTWDPHVRDIDTTNGFSDYYNESHSLPKGEEKEWLHVNVMPFHIKSDDKWLSSREGLSKDMVKSTIEVKDENGESWIVLYGYNTMTPTNEELVLDDTEMGLWEFIQAYTVPRKQRNNVAKYINKMGTQNRDMPEYRNKIYELFYKDYYSSASYRVYAFQTKLDEWSDFKDSGFSFQIGYLPYTCEGELTLNRPNKLLYDILGLKDGEREGDYVDTNERLIAFDPSVRYQNDGQLVVRKKELVNALNKNQVSLVWPILLEKQIGTSIIGCQMGGSAYMTERGRIKVRLRLYKDRVVNAKRRARNQIIQNCAKLAWYTLTFNKVERTKIRMKMMITKIYEVSILPLRSTGTEVH